ncbi:hypothetical protein CASFOL_023033 [Castilleja foliolosa]|uniref:Uncharacterized protein n=1 Tax=Castilleja foliolosa TaxID=1961234 RepID=A0ABD3CLG1_9LAMI
MDRRQSQPSKDFMNVNLRGRRCPNAIDEDQNKSRSLNLNRLLCRHHEAEADNLQMEEQETYPYPGGPDDNSVLTSYKKHVARALWRGIERGILKTIYHSNKLLEWSIDSNSSFDYFKKIYMVACPWCLLCCTLDVTKMSLML